ncbi:MAG: TolC family protein, partial [Gemmatimonadota bacterium]
MSTDAEGRSGGRSFGWGGAAGWPLPAAVVAGTLLALLPAIGGGERVSGMASFGLAAQDPGPSAGDTVVLGMADALRIAEGSNPAYRRAVNELGMNGVESRATWANDLLPNASLDLFSTSYTGNVQRIARDNFGNPIENPQAEWVYFSGTTQSLGLSWNIQGSSLLDRWKGQQRTNLDRELAEAAALSTAHANVRSRFYDVLEQRSLLEVEERIARAREADLELAEQLFRLAGNTRVDLLRARFQIQQQAVNVQQQRNAYEQAKLALRTALGDADLGPFR